MQDIWTRLSKLQPITERHSRYGELWNLGMSSLQAAQETPDKSHYLQSGHAFVKAIKAIPNRPEAWLGLSYLLYLLGDEASALFYTRQVLSNSPDLPEAQELCDLLDSSYQLNSLMSSVNEMGSSQDWVELPPERLTENETVEILHQAQALLQIQHLLVNYELDAGRFIERKTLQTRLQDLDALRGLLTEQLVLFRDEPFWGQLFKDLFARLDQDLLSLTQLDLLFEAMERFQSEVKTLFAELTRRTLRLRVQGSTELEDNMNYVMELHMNLQKLAHKMSAWPANLRAQAENSSGWPHMLQQTRQFQEKLNELAQSPQA